jgi:hypothetical protein
MPYEPDERDLDRHVRRLRELRIAGEALSLALVASAVLVAIVTAVGWLIVYG